MNLGGLKYWLEISIAWFWRNGLVALVATLRRNGPNYRNNWTDSSNVPGGWASYTENSDDEEIGDKNDIDNDFKLFPQP